MHSIFQTKRRTVLTLALAASMACASWGALAAEPIRIGSVLSVTGPAAFLGDPELKTLQLYVEEINKKGGVLGRPLELVHYDDGSDAAKANSFGKRLIEDDKVDILIGGTTTGSTMSIVPLVEKAGIPFISLAGAVVVIEPVKKWVFKTPHTDRMAAEKVFEDMKKRGISKIALLSETSGLALRGKRKPRVQRPALALPWWPTKRLAPRTLTSDHSSPKLRTRPRCKRSLYLVWARAPRSSPKTTNNWALPCRTTSRTA